MEDEEAETKVWLLRWEQGEVVIWGGIGLKRKKDYFFNPCVCVCVCVYVLCHVWLFVTPWTVAHQVLLSMESSGQKYWSRLPFPSPGDLPNPGIELTSPVSPALRLILYPLSHLGSHKYECMYVYVYIYIYVYTHKKKCSRLLINVYMHVPCVIFSSILQIWKISN